MNIVADLVNELQLEEGAKVKTFSDVQPAPHGMGVAFHSRDDDSWWFEPVYFVCKTREVFTIGSTQHVVETLEPMVYDDMCLVPASQNDCDNTYILIMPDTDWKEHILTTWPDAQL